MAIRTTQNHDTDLRCRLQILCHEICVMAIRTTQNHDTHLRCRLCLLWTCLHRNSMHARTLIAKDSIMTQNCDAGHNVFNPYVPNSIPKLERGRMYSHMWHDSFTHVTWLIHIRAMTHVYMPQAAFMTQSCDQRNPCAWSPIGNCICYRGLTRVCVMTHSHMTWLMYTCHNSRIYAMTHSWHRVTKQGIHARLVPLEIIYMTGLTHVCVMMPWYMRTWHNSCILVITHWYAWHDSFIGNCICAMTHSYMWMTHSYTWHDSFMYTLQFRLEIAYVTGLTHVCGMVAWCMRDMTQQMYTWHHSFIHVPWRIHTRAMTHSYTCHDSFIHVNDSFIHVTWLIHTHDMTHSYVYASSQIGNFLIFSTFFSYVYLYICIDIYTHK